MGGKRAEGFTHAVGAPLSGHHSQHQRSTPSWGRKARCTVNTLRPQLGVLYRHLREAAPTMGENLQQEKQAMPY